VLGRQITYFRRKRDAECYNSDSLGGHIVSVNNCNCTEVDYECDFDYELTVTSNKCVYSGDTSYEMSTCVGEQTTYKQTQGYRKIADDSCVNGLSKYEPIEQPCPATPLSPSQMSSNSSSGLGIGAIFAIVGGVILAVVLALLVGIVLGSKNEALRSRLPWLKNLRFPGISYSHELQLNDDEEPQ